MPARKKGRSGKYEPTSFERWRSSLVALTLKRKIPRPPREPYDGDVIVHIRYWRGDNYRRDKPGMEDALWSYLALDETIVRGPDGKRRLKKPGTGWVIDDCQLTPAWEIMELDRETPRVELTLHRLGPT